MFTEGDSRSIHDTHFKLCFSVFGDLKKTILSVSNNQRCERHTAKKKKKEKQSYITTASMLNNVPKEVDDEPRS